VFKTSEIFATSSYVYLLDDQTRIKNFHRVHLQKPTKKNLQKPTEKTQQNTKSTAIYLPVSHFNKSPLSDPPPSHRDAVPSATAVWDVSVATPGPPFRRTSSANAAPEP
jgi:hypothetical protein